jgi:hypothetical protein
MLTVADFQLHRDVILRQRCDLAEWLADRATARANALASLELLRELYREARDDQQRQALRFRIH